MKPGIQSCSEVKTAGSLIARLSFSAQHSKGVKGLSNLSLTVPRYTNGRACDLNDLQEIIHVSRLSFFTRSCTRNFFVCSLKERNYTYSMYLSTVKVGSEQQLDSNLFVTLPPYLAPYLENPYLCSETQILRK